MIVSIASAGTFFDRFGIRFGRWHLVKMLDTTTKCDKTRLRNKLFAIGPNWRNGNKFMKRDVRRVARPTNKLWHICICVWLWFLFILRQQIQQLSEQKVCNIQNCLGISIVCDFIEPFQTAFVQSDLHISWKKNELRTIFGMKKKKTNKKKRTQYSIGKCSLRFN